MTTAITPQERTPRWPGYPWRWPAPTRASWAERRRGSAPTSTGAASPTPSSTSRSPGCAGNSAPTRRPSGRRQPARHEPHRQWRACAVEDRAGGHRRTSAAPGAPDPAIPQPPAAVVAAGRAHEALWPPQSLEVVHAVGVGREPRHQLTRRGRVVLASHRTGRRHAGQRTARQLRLTGYPPRPTSTPPPGRTGAGRGRRPLAGGPPASRPRPVLSSTPLPCSAEVGSTGASHHACLGRSMWTACR